MSSTETFDLLAIGCGLAGEKAGPSLRRMDSGISPGTNSAKARKL